MVDKFLDSSKLVQAICLLVPVLGWITELIIRFDVMAHNPHIDNIVMFILAIPFGTFIGYVDLVVVVLLNGDFVLMK